MNFSEYARLYLSNKSYSWSASTRRTYQDVLEDYLDKIIGSRPIEDILREDFDKIARVMHTDLGLSNSTITKTLSFTSNVLRYAVDNNRRTMAAPSPNCVKLPKTIKEEIDPLTPAELNAVLSALSEHDRPLFTCLAWTGARPNEMCALQWSDIDFDKNEIVISKGRVRGVEGSTKTGKLRRISMPKIVKDTLLRLPRESSYVFLNKAGKPIDGHLDRIWANASVKAGVKHRPSYNLRHSFASIALSSGIPIAWLSQQLGHSNVLMTIQNYATFMPSVDTTSAPLLDAISSSAQQSIGA